MTPRSDFERAATDHFSFDCLDVGQPTKLRIKHDNSGSNPAWFLDRVVIAAEDGTQAIFPCYQWLDKDSGDGYIERVLLPGDVAEPVMSNYTVSVFTGTQRGAGTDANVTIQIKGTPLMDKPK